MFTYKAVKTREEQGRKNKNQHLQCLENTPSSLMFCDYDDDVEKHPKN